MDEGLSPIPHERALERLQAQGVRVLYEDNHLLVVQKPAGLPSQGGPNIHHHLAEALEAYRREAEEKPGRAYVGLVHRLDVNVGGVVVTAKTSKAASRLSAAFRDRVDGLEKNYLAWVGGSSVPTEAVLTNRLRRDAKVTHETFADDPEGREARLAYEVDGRGRNATRLAIELHTGIAHQIRAQMSIAGHPILGDVKYGGRKGRLLALFARRLVIPHPIGGELVEFIAPVSKRLIELDRAVRIKPPFRE